jgi:hypothetical protein
MAHKVLVSERALIQRINRKLKPEGRKLKSGRGAYGRSLGLYMIDLDRNGIVSSQLDLEHLAQQLRVLGAWEKLAAE